jgi:hypothetical protein
MDTNRLSKELREIASDKASGVSVELVGDSLAHMRGTITGTNHLSLLSLKLFDVQIFPKTRRGKWSLFTTLWFIYIRSLV